MANRALVSALRDALARHADATKASGMQAYMKSALPFRGVPAPVQQGIWREVLAAQPIAGEAAWRSTVLALWRHAAFREERYAAIALTGHRLYDTFQTPAAIPLYEELIVTGAWWDYVDVIASRRIGRLLAAYPVALGRVLRSWSRDQNMWKRRTAILAQLTFKERTDLRLLYACITPNMSDSEFFVRKAIGWALRQYAWTDASEVARFVAAHADALSPLSRREALRNVETSRSGRRRPGMSSRHNQSVR
jgi:3-methyladenine DNA glycosylase AlkD